VSSLSFSSSSVIASNVLVDFKNLIWFFMTVLNVGVWMEIKFGKRGNFGNGMVDLSINYVHGQISD